MNDHVWGQNGMYPLLCLLHSTINHGCAWVEALCDVLRRPGKPIGHAVPVPISSAMPRSRRWKALNITLGPTVNHTWHFPRQQRACAWLCLSFFQYTLQQWIGIVLSREDCSTNYNDRLLKMFLKMFSHNFPASPNLIGQLLHMVQNN